MANDLYAKGREGFLDGSIDWDTDTIKVVLVDGADYTPDLTLHDTLSDIPSAARVAVSPALTGKTVVDGVADADDVTLTSVTGDQFEYVIIYQDTGDETTSRLILFIDDATGLPCTPNGSDITIQWPDTADKIFKL